MSVLKNFRLELWVVRTLIAIQKSEREPSEKETIVKLINEAAAQKGLVYKPCPNMKMTCKGKEGLEVECAKKGVVTFDPHCLECELWMPSKIAEGGSQERL